MEMERTEKRKPVQGKVPPTWLLHFYTHHTCGRAYGVF